MRFRSLLTYLSLLPLGACTRCKDFDNASEFYSAKLPDYTETGANKLGCHLGPQVWTVLGRQDLSGSGGSGPEWLPNALGVELENTPRLPRSLRLTGAMTGARSSRIFYNTRIQLTFLPTDSLGTLRRLGEADYSLVPAGQPYEYMQVENLLTDTKYSSRARRPVRLVISHLNRQRRIISGRFEGWVYGGPNGRDSLEVSDGRFDVTY
ncbi:hypothetical protein GCM10023185_16810 [Hymenobacter saemangeumensis]|uniref:Uncharacterized protein n=1 Tax=Hymenobacter saemangeumensis TaxID=1084522 RepID=A0ABP8IA91_9BACT